MSASLTTRTTLGLMPLAIGILLRHYYEKVLKDNNKSKNGDGAVPLRLEELMYDEAFTITRVSLPHTVEELQHFARLYTPAGPSYHVVRLTVPQSCCAEAARVLVPVLGGEHEARRVVGGVRWWQVRPGDGGIRAEWITDKSDWKEAKRLEKTQTLGESASPQSASSSSSSSGAHAQAGADDPEENVYRPEMDEMRCLLWAHGGKFLLTWTGKRRYMIQRYAHKMQGRVFAPRYRLSPQYPFPCALQDLLASCACRVTPPAATGSAHRPIKPSHIVVGGDSAGGGLAIAFLQVVRDSGLPPPAGGVLISPCIFLNTDTDIVPATGLTIYKPSTLWPPPPDDVNLQVHGLLCNSARNRRGAAVVPSDDDGGNRETEAPVVRPDDRETVVRATGEDGETVEIRNQINSPDREVLRDEIVYTAHRAANPEKYPVSDASRMKPTTVHLQIYDDAAHVIPMMFMATNPAKYCYRSIATFIKHVTNMPPTAKLQKHKPLQTSDLTGETVSSPIASSPPAENDPPTTAPPSTPTKPKGFSRMTSSFRRGSSLFSKSSRALLAKPESPGHDSSRTMIRERISTHGIVRPLEPESEIPALHIDPAHLGVISARWARVYLAGRAIALLRSQDSHEVSQVGEAAGWGREKAETEVEGEGWSVTWALDDPNERPPPSSLVARCDTVEALALARLPPLRTEAECAARGRHVGLPTRTRKRRMQDGEEKGKKAARSRPGGELWRRLSRGHSTAPAPAAIGATVVQPQVVVVA
ncbi:Alpha/Beta hydrolase protein [Lactarius quietus]|nr:Alpha/Beta hydrolase protein [Lactarius quietus]